MIIANLTPAPAPSALGPRPPIRIGWVGQMRAGKDLAGAYIQQQIGGTIEKLADPLYKAASAVHNALNVPASSPLRIRDRVLLQLLGTEYGRNVFGPDVWVDHLLRRIDGRSDAIQVTDVRFVNEAVALQKAGFMLCGIRRPDADRLRDGASHKAHASEREIPELIAKYCDVTINNDGSLEDFYRALDRVPRLASQTAWLLRGAPGD